MHKTFRAVVCLFLLACLWFGCAPNWRDMVKLGMGIGQCIGDAVVDPTKFQDASPVQTDASSAE